MKKLLLITITLFTLTHSQAQGWGEIQKIVPDDRFVAQRFGRSVAIDDDYAVIGMENNQGFDQAGAYVFKNDGNGNWLQIQKLGNPNYHQFDQPGFKVAISGDYIFVSDPGEDYDASGSNFFTSAGAVYIFKNDGSDNWNFTQKIVASDREPGVHSQDHYGNQLGHSLAVNGNYAAVGVARQDLDASGANDINNAGAVYIFELDVASNTWSEVQKIVASDRGVSDYFGRYSVSIDGDFLVVGAKQEDEDMTGMNTIPNAGSVYVFERDGNGTWNEIQKIVASDREQGEWFGSAVVISGDTIVVGAENEYPTGNTGTQHGAAYVFERDINSVWNEVQKIIPSNIQHGSDFGHALDIDGNHIIIGAYSTDIGSQLSAGAAFMFEKDGSGLWSEVAVMYNPNANDYEEFLGFDVAVSGSYAIVGAYQEEEDETETNTLGDAGAVYMFDVNEPNTLPPLNTLGIVETDLNSEIKAFPNPFQNVLYLDLGRYCQSIQINIYNTLGQNVFSENYTNSSTIQLEISQSKGLYFVEINCDENYPSVLKVLKY